MKDKLTKFLRFLSGPWRWLLERLLNDAALRSRMSRKARETVAEWTQENQALGFRQAIEYVS